jgi:N-formylglutamate amidohydrolase
MKKKKLTGGEDLFKSEIKSSLIFHIPHSRTLIPDYSGFDLTLIDNEIQLLTDHATEDIFNIPDTNKIVFPFSRIFCDVERLPDDQEEMEKFGRGFYYTKTDSEKELRKLNKRHKKTIFNEYYLKHHKILFDKVSQSLISTGIATIIDCHSFSNSPFNSDLNKEVDRPDVCIGTDSYHTPKFLENMVRIGFEKHNLKVEINSPYSGTIVPTKYYKSNEGVYSIMIEINRTLYMRDGKVDFRKVAWVNSIIREIFA